MMLWTGEPFTADIKMLKSFAALKDMLPVDHPEHSLVYQIGQHDVLSSDI